MTSTITGGTVSIEDGTKAKEEYAPARKVRVELSFGVPEGGDASAFLNGVADLAQAKIGDLLGRPAAPAALKATRAKAPVPEPQEVPSRTKADLEREAGLPVTAKEPAATKDDLDDLLGETATAPITDAELGKAAQEKNGSMKDKPGWAPQKIRSLVASYNGNDPAKKLQDIPAANRADFLAALKALT